jgi:hypothetical protein
MAKLLKFTPAQMSSISNIFKLTVVRHLMAPGEPEYVCLIDGHVLVSDYSKSVLIENEQRHL